MKLSWKKNNGNNSHSAVIGRIGYANIEWADGVFQGTILGIKLKVTRTDLEEMKRLVENVTQSELELALSRMNDLHLN